MLAPKAEKRVVLRGRLAYIPPGKRTASASLELRAGGGAPVLSRGPCSSARPPAG